MNKVILIGNLAADPELRRTPSDVPVCTFRLAVQRRFSNQQGVREADFFTVVVWRQQAENCAKYLAKGRKCAVVGSLQTRSYDAQDGTKRYVTEVVADEVEFLSSAGSSGAPRDMDVPLPEVPPERPNTSAPMSAGFSQVDDDDLPF